MVTILTYLRDSGGGFTAIEDCREAPPDPEYIEGAIELKVDGVEIIGMPQWDYVDQLWSYILSMGDRLQRGDTCVDTYFPDQPINLKFEKDGRRVLISAKVRDGVRRASVDEGELMVELRRAGRLFFNKISELVPSGVVGYQAELTKLG